MAKSKKLQEEIWTKSNCRYLAPNSHADAGKLLLPALNSMIDITTIRRMALQPIPEYHLWTSVQPRLICSLLAGYRMAIGQASKWLHILSFAASRHRRILIIDVEYPRAGLIRSRRLIKRSLVFAKT